MANNGKITPRENRLLINGLLKSVDEIKEDIKKLTNHYSKRLPAWATIVITILASLITGLVVASAR